MRRSSVVVDDDDGVARSLCLSHERRRKTLLAQTQEWVENFSQITGHNNTEYAHTHTRMAFTHLMQRCNWYYINYGCYRCAFLAIRSEKWANCEPRRRRRPASNGVARRHNWQKDRFMQSTCVPLNSMLILFLFVRLPDAPSVAYSIEHFQLISLLSHHRMAVRRASFAHNKYSRFGDGFQFNSNNSHIRALISILHGTHTYVWKWLVARELCHVGHFDATVWVCVCVWKSLGFLTFLNKIKSSHHRRHSHIKTLARSALFNWQSTISGSVRFAKKKKISPPSLESTWAFFFYAATSLFIQFSSRFIVQLFR